MISEAVVVGVGPRWLSVIVSALAVEHRIYFQDLVLNSSSYDAKEEIVTLNWPETPGEKTEKSIEQKLSMFSLVNLRLFTDLSKTRMDIKVELLHPSLALEKPPVLSAQDDSIDIDKIEADF